jgi:hypothetical protein
MSDAAIVTLRIPSSLLERADALLESLAENEEALVLGRPSRSIVLRLAVLRGIEQLEAQVAGASSKKVRQIKKR